MKIQSGNKPTNLEQTHVEPKKKDFHKETFLSLPATHLDKKLF